MLQGFRISGMLGFANFQNQRDRSSDVTLFYRYSYLSNFSSARFFFSKDIWHAFDPFRRWFFFQSAISNLLQVNIFVQKEYLGVATKLLFSLQMYVHLHTWNPNDPCFDWKRPCFGGSTFKNKGHWGSRCTSSIFETMHAPSWHPIFCRTSSQDAG